MVVWDFLVQKVKKENREKKASLVSEAIKERRDSRACWGRRVTHTKEPFPSGQMVTLVMLATQAKAPTEEISERLDIKGNPDQWDQKAQKGWSDGALGV